LTIEAKPAGVGDRVYQSRKVVSVIRSKSEPGSEVIVTAGVEVDAIWRPENDSFCDSLDDAKGETGDEL
jgi:hypothetical protein